MDILGTTKMRLTTEVATSRRVFPPGTLFYCTWTGQGWRSGMNRAGLIPDSREGGFVYVVIGYMDAEEIGS